MLIMKIWNGEHRWWGCFICDLDKNEVLAFLHIVIQRRLMGMTRAIYLLSHSYYLLLSYLMSRNINVDSHSFISHFQCVRVFLCRVLECSNGPNITKRQSYMKRKVWFGTFYLCTCELRSRIENSFYMCMM